MSARRSIALATLTATGLLTACGTSDPSTDLAAPKGRKDTGVNIGPDQDRLRGKKAAAAAGLVPEAIRKFLQSGRVDAHLGPSPAAAYHVASAGRSEIAGRLSGAGGDLQGKIAATTKKGSGLVEAYAAAIDHIVQDGSYAKVLGRWGLSGEAVEKSEINPPGLPRTKS